MGLPFRKHHLYPIRRGTNLGTTALLSEADPDNPIQLGFSHYRCIMVSLYGTTLGICYMFQSDPTALCRAAIVALEPDYNGIVPEGFLGI